MMEKLRENKDPETENDGTDRNPAVDGPPHPHGTLPMMMMIRGPPKRGSEKKSDAEAEDTDPTIDGPPFPPRHGYNPPMAWGPPPMFERRGARFMVNHLRENEDAESPNEGDAADPNPAVDGPHPFPHHYHGPRPMMWGPPPMFGRRKKETSDTEEENGDTDPNTTVDGTSSFPHHHNGTPSMMMGPPPMFGHYHHPFHPHIHRRRRHQHQLYKKMMLMSLLQEQKDVMEKFEHQNREEARSHQQSETSSAIQVPQQWHIDETDEVLTLSIDVAGFRLENLEIKVEHGLLSLHGRRTNSLGDVFELFRTRMIDPLLYDDAGIEARCDHQDKSCSSVVSITIPKKKYIPPYDGAIPIQVAPESPNEVSNEPSTRTTTDADVLEGNEKEQREAAESIGWEDNIFSSETATVFEREAGEVALLGQVETVEDSPVARLEAPQELQQPAITHYTLSDSDTTQSWEDVGVDGREN